MRGLLIPPDRIRLLEAHAQTNDQGAANSGTTTFATTLTIPANTLQANVHLRVTALFQLTTGTVTQIYNLLAGATPIYTSATITPAALTTRSMGMEWIISGTAAPGGSVAVITGTLSSPFQNTTATQIGQMANTVAQGVNLATNAPITLSLTVTWGASTAGNTSNLLQFIMEQIGP